MKHRKLVGLLLIAFITLSAQITRKYDTKTSKQLYIKDGKELALDEVNGEVKEFSLNDSTKVKAIYNYKNGKLDGLQKEFFDSGSLSAEYNMKDGQRDGLGREFFDDGKLAFERTLVNGNGIGTEFFNNGQIKRLRKYEGGKQVSVSFLNQDFEGKAFVRDEIGSYAEAQQFAIEGMYHHAIKAFEEFTKKFPKSEFAPNARFLIGFTYNNHLHDQDKAREQYQQFMKEYPNHSLFQSAQYELENIGKDIEELLKADNN